MTTLVFDAETAEECKESAVQFSDRSIRLAFIRKVYAILSAQLIITFGFVAVFLFVDEVKTWSSENPWVFLAAFGVTIVLVIMLSCCVQVRRSFPANFICLFIFTAAEGFLIGAISSYYRVDSVMLAVGVTAFICVSLSIFAFQTKIDFTGWGGALFVVLVVFIVFGFLLFLLPRDRFPIWYTVYAGAGALLFSLYLILDTQLMIGGHMKHSISPEEYIFAALNIYLDIVNIFLYILAMMGRN